MATEYISVIEVCSAYGFPNEVGSKLFIGEKETIVPQAEKYFLALCRQSDSLFDKDNDKDDIKNILEKGIYELKNYTVFINWPSVK